MPTVEAIAPSFFVKDLGRSIDWYVRVLGFALPSRPPAMPAQFYNVLNQRYYCVDGFYDTTPSEELQ
jgi:catechol 2,3-dioxygenase-like lactoylglutathione lyase family enzyme